ncbi:MAG: 5-methyltetrahydropteroyltriglutamate--homocysteine S-methyltransferase [Thermomicrobiales bacterium]
MAIASIPGYPRIGKKRELKRALEGCWAGKRGADELEATAREIRAANWRAQRNAGIDLIPVNDFSLYDHVLDTTALVGAVPERYGRVGETVDLDSCFAMARGRIGDRGVPAMEMTKWFDSNYHYIVPELGAGQAFHLASDKPFAELAEARALGMPAKPVLLGPLTYLLLSKSVEEGFDPLSLLDGLLPVYAEVVARLAAEGAEWIELDEPALVQDRAPTDLAALERAYSTLAEAKGSAKLLVQTAYGQVGEAYQTLVGLPVDGVGLDLIRGPENLDLIARHGYPEDMWLAAGIVDGRNVWVTDLDAALGVLERLVQYVPADRLMVSASCSLLHVPLDVRLEEDLNPEVSSWLAFAEQKLTEIVTLTRAVNEGSNAVAAELEANRRIVAGHRAAASRHDRRVQERLAALSDADRRRASPFARRAAMQRDRLGLPLLPTTTIGSFPQTGDLRTMRSKLDKGEIEEAAYDRYIEEEIAAVIREQEELGLDVLVHGEPERNDMVQYFGERLAGFVTTHHGWVQSYGSRYVRPPIIFGDVSRPEPLTVRWSTFAQSRSERPVKGMLTGPVTILNWSFVRDDQPRAETCRQIALAIRDEVADLDAAGLGVIQIDEPAMREGVPLRRADQGVYLDWAVECFRIAAAGARDETQIHSHMCYSEFGDVIDAIAALDADVISIENARSDLALVKVLRRHGYDKGVGPGVYDIHSPRVPPVEEMATNLRAVLDVLDPVQVWVNPDCGLKTRRWEEVRPALRNMIEAAAEVRSSVAVGMR